MNRQDLQKKLNDAAQRLQGKGARVIVDVDINGCLILIASLQLALRHPRYPVASKRQMKEMVDHLILMLEREEPVIGQVLRVGNRWNPGGC